MTPYLQKRLLRRTGNLRQEVLLGKLIDFASNDYLGLARAPKLLELTQQALGGTGCELNGLGSTGSRLLTGNSSFAEKLEKSIASFHGYESALLFNCGYMANLGVLSTVAGPDDVIIYDAKIHASMSDGIKLSAAKRLPFWHNDVLHLEKRLKNCPAGATIFIAIESIYSTDGSRAPLEDMCRLAKQYGAHLIVDEAHAVGVYGPDGRGLVAELGLANQVFALIVTFGKALGVHGAACLSSLALRDMLVNFSRPYIYTTALPMHSLAAIQASYSLLPSLQAERAHLQTLIGYYKTLNNSSSDTHIQAVLLPGNAQVKSAAKKLQQCGFDVRPLTSPTVQRGHEVLRISLHAYNTQSELRLLLQHIEIDQGDSK